MKPLNPILAALLAVSVAAQTAPKPAAPTSKAAPGPDCDKVLEKEEHSVPKALGCVFEKKWNEKYSPSQWITWRIILWGQAHSFIDPSLGLESTNKTINDWVEANRKKGLVTLYTVLGPTDPRPAFVNETPVLKDKNKFKPENGNTLKLNKLLTDEMWATDKKVRKEGNLIPFLDRIIKAAAEVLRSGSPKETTLIGKKDTPVAGDAGDKSKEKGAAASAAPPEAGVALRLSGKGFEDNDHYSEGGEGGPVYGRDDPGRRDLYVKIFTVKDDKGRLQDMIGVYDNTERADGKKWELGYGVNMFPISATGEQKFQFKPDEEITNKETGKKETIYHRGYILRIVDGQVVIRRDVKNADEGKSLSVSLDKLFVARADQVKSVGQSVTIGSEKFYTLGQGDDKYVSCLFFRQSDIDYRTGAKRALSPVAMVHYMKGGSDGNPKYITSWNPSLGELRDGVNPDGSPKKSEFRLVCDGQFRQCKVMHGKGDPDPEDPKPETKESKTEPGDSSTGGSRSTAAGKMNTLEDLLKKYPKWKDKSEGLDDETKKRMRIMVDEEGGYHFVSPELAGQVYNSPGELRGFKKYLVSLNSNGKQAIYRSLSDLLAEDTKINSGVLVGHAMKDVTDPEVANDMLSTYMGHKDIGVDRLTAAAKKYAPTGKYSFATITDGGLLLQILTENKTCTFWPKDKGCVSTSSIGAPKPRPAPSQGATPDAKPAAGGKGGKTASKTDEKTESCVAIGEDDKKWEVSNLGQKLGGGKENDDACLRSKGNSLWLYVRYNSKEGGGAAPPVYISRKEIGPNFFYKSLVGGAALEGVTSQSSIVRVAGSDQDKKGVYGFFRTGEQSPAPGAAGGWDKAGNCLGVVLWWGMNEPEALKACQSGSVQ